MIQLNLVKQSGIILSLLFLPFSAIAQSTGNSPQDDVQVGVSGMEKYTQIETQLGQDLPLILESIQLSAKQVEQNKFEAAQATLKRGIQEARIDEKIFSKESHYREIAEYVDKMEDALTQANEAMAAKKRAPSLQNLRRAYTYTKAISESPVLKLAASEIALGQASREIRNGNYESAGLFLQRSIDYVVEAQKDPRLKNREELNKLKNEMIITQQQVVLGKMKDEKRLNNFYPGLAAARVNAFNDYYSIWNQGEIMPWDLN